MLSGKCRMQCELMIRILWLCTGKYLSSSKKHSREPQKIEKVLGWWDQENYFAKLSFQPNKGQRFTMTIENTISHRSTYSTLPYHCFLLVLVFLSQLAFGGTQTKTGLVPGLGCLGHRAWTSLWFFSWFNLNQTPSLSVFNCWPQKSAFGASDSCFRSLETCSHVSSHVLLPFFMYTKAEELWELTSSRQIPWPGACNLSECKECEKGI